MRSSIIFRIVLTFHSRSRAPARGSGSGRKTETFTDIVDESVHPGKGFLSPRSSARELVGGRTLQFTVSLQFANSNADNRLAPSVLHDGNGCRPGKNVVLADLLGWTDSCALGVSGDWVLDVVYRRVECNPPPPEKRFVRGDDNQDGTIDISDPLYNLGYQFLGGPGNCLEAMDTNDDGRIDLSDPVYDLAFLFIGGPAPPEPHPGCGPGPGPNPLGCEDSPLCR